MPTHQPLTSLPSGMVRVLLLSTLAALASPAAWAQSSVNIYGRVNLSVERQKIGDAHENALVNNASRFGFTGSEDLGGGLKAGFKLESGFDADTGKLTSTALFGRDSHLILSSDSWGMVRMGNILSEAYLATADFVSMHNHDTGTSADALYAFPTIRDVNKIAYRTPVMKGFTAEVAASLPETEDGKRVYDAAANYDGGPLQLGAGYNKNDKAEQFALRALYSWDAFTVGGYVQRDKNAWAEGRRTTTRLSGMYTLNATEFHLNWGRAGSYSDVPSSSANQYTVGINYNLSKRTKLYTFYTKISDKAALYGGDFSSFAVGMRQNF